MTETEKAGNPQTDSSRVVNKTARLLGRSVIIRFGLLYLLCLVIALLISPYFSSTVDRYVLGQFTASAIRAPYDITIPDEAATERKREEAVINTIPVSKIDSQVQVDIKKKIASAFNEQQKFFVLANKMKVMPEEEQKKRSKKKREALQAKLDENAEQFLKEKLKESRPLFEKALGIDLSNSQWNLLFKEQYGGRIIRGLNTMISDFYYKPVAYDLERFQSVVIGDPEKKDGPGKLAIKDTSSGTETIISDISILRDPNVDEEWFVQKAKSLLPDYDSSTRKLLAKIVKAQIKPTLILDMEETEKKRKAALEAVIPVSINLKKNELIIGEGLKITEEKLLILDFLREQRLPENFTSRLIATSIFVYMLILLGFWIADINIDRFVITDQDFIYLTAGLIITIFAFRVWLFIVNGIVMRDPTIPEIALVLMFPVASVAMLTRFLLNFEIALVQAAVVSILLGLLSDLQLLYTTYTLLVSLVGSHMIARCARRGSILKAGLWTGGASLAASICVIVLAEGMQGLSSFWILGGALLGGIFAGFVVVGISPIAEFLFGYTTNISLLELANYENPLLKKIMVETPGTFQHSISIGVLAEAAAEAVGANALLVRVGALYHDAGKTQNPKFFAENQSGKNPHDDIPPIQSAEIIREHVTSGVRLVRKHRLGETIADFVREHHGTGLIKYFIAKAQKTEKEVNPEDYRYPGPKPHSKETGILMIADQVEATARTMAGANEGEYKTMVLQTIERIRSEKQLDECPLSLKDLAKIQVAFVQVLTGIHHQRVKYPGQKGKSILRSRPRWFTSSRNS